MLRKNLLLLTHNFTLQLQEFNNGNFLNLSKFILKTNSKQSVRYMNVKVLCKQNIVHKRLKHNIPLQYVSVSTNVTDLYIMDQIVAEQFISLIEADLQKNASHVIELNPGLGFTTQQLIKIGIPFVHMYERDTQFIDTLSKLCNKFPNKLSLQKADLYNLSKSMHINNANNNVDISYDLLENVQRKQWNKESCMQIIGVTNRITFLRHLILSTVFRTCFMAYGRPIFYLAIPPSIWNKFTDTTMKPSNVMFQTIFDYHVFGEVNIKALIPSSKRRLMKEGVKHTHKLSSMQLKRGKYSNDISYLYVVKIEPKLEIPILRHGKDDLFHFWYFIRHNLYKPTMRVIPSLEKLVPGCGIRLIALNLNVFTQYNDLNIKQIQDLYVEFRSWPEFEESIFTSNATDIKSMYDNYIIEEEENQEYNSSINIF